MSGIDRKAVEKVIRMLTDRSAEAQSYANGALSEDNKHRWLMVRDTWAGAANIVKAELLSTEEPTPPITPVNPVPPAPGMTDAELVAIAALINACAVEGAVSDWYHALNDEMTRRMGAKEVRGG